MTERSISQKVRAMANLDKFFTDPNSGRVDDGKRLESLRALRNVTIRMATEVGLSEAERLQKIREELMNEGVIDPNNIELATGELRILQEGYDAAPDLWDKWIGRQRRYEQDISEL